MTPGTLTREQVEMLLPLARHDAQIVCLDNNMRSAVGVFTALAVMIDTDAALRDELAAAQARVKELEQALRLHLAVAPDDPLLLTPLEQQDAALQQAAQEAGKALEESLALNVNWSAEAEPEILAYYSEYKAVIKQATKALAALRQAGVKG